MLSDPQFLGLQTLFPEFSDPDTAQILKKNAVWHTVSEGEAWLQPGQYVKWIPLVTSGSLKVLRQSPDGHELFLYYLNPGQTCAMVLSCCGAQTASELIITAEEKTELVLIPLNATELLSQVKGWKNFVANNYAQRFQELLEVIDGIAFRKMDERLAAYLDNKAQQLKTRHLKQTHQEIAQELGTSREVISRLLKHMEQQGQITLHRNSLHLQ